MSERQQKWDERFLSLAQHIAGWSQDPSTQVGAVIVDADRRIVSMGFNGFPQGVADLDERLQDRPLKYALTVHAETNAILFARRSLAGCTLYTWPLMPCSRCATNVVQSGIARCVAPALPPDKAERWERDCDLARMMFAEVGVELAEGVGR